MLESAGTAQIRSCDWDPVPVHLCALVLPLPTCLHSHSFWPWITTAAQDARLPALASDRSSGWLPPYLLVVMIDIQHNAGDRSSRRQGGSGGRGLSSERCISGTQREDERDGCRSWVREEAEPRKEGGIFREGPTGKGESKGGFVGWNREEASD